MLGIPDAEALSSKVSAIPTAPVASKALINAAEQIRSWISKALDVVSGLDSEDDVEWAAAGGREGLEEVESAINRFEHLINAYVNAIDELQNRHDIANVSTDDLRRAVAQMEAIAEEWARIKRTLQSVRNQVEIAMEWEELWNSVLGDIQGEMDELSRLVFEMEERRHKSLAVVASGDNVDIGDLETIVEENPLSASRLHPSNRLSLALPLSPNSPGTSTLSQDDSSLLALFARMQPLRASLDFLPMRLSVFEVRGKHAFPTACEELEMRRDGLDASYKKLEKDAESLRKELGEDRWVIVFRGAGRQAQKMHESVERSLMKLREAIEAGMHLTNQPSIAKKIESYEAKKTHYGPAIERVLAIIDKGVKDRLTVNGEILRLHTEMQTRWESLKLDIGEMDLVLEDIYAERKSQQLRDSISSMLSNDRSTNGSGMETPGSSPPSSVIMTGLGFDPHTPARKQGGNQLRSPNASASSLMSASANRRNSSLPAPVAKLSKKPGSSRLSTIMGSSSSSYYPPSASLSTLRPSSTMGHRPRWNTSANALDVDASHSPYRTPAPQRSTSAITPISTSKLPTPRSSLTRTGSESPMMESFSRSFSRTGHSRLSFRERLTSPGPYSQSGLTKQSSSSSSRRSNVQPSASTLNLDNLNNRPSSSLASSRRSSLLPMPRGRPDSTRGSSPLPIFSRFSSRKYSDNPPEPKDLKPRWRF
ncbi:karyogamy, kar9 [Trichoderma arundinaceum]|uniref:Karyogamy, kar9 n=1 Tax=Trichoderma arundinaceum TaxID=490622 RepID=A0A395NFW6_TRIAR|nr:karyogamy, kar9 [Trichoderma arundinaceum]